MTTSKWKSVVDVSEMDNNQFQYHTLSQELEKLETEQRALFAKMFQVVEQKKDMIPGAWLGMGTKYRVINCKVGDFLETARTIYKRVA